MKSLGSFKNIADHLIRPPKFTYSLNDLGPSIFEINNKIYQRIDFTVKSQKDNHIQASMWKLKHHIMEETFTHQQTSMLIYLHCNCGSRVQAMQLVNESLELGYTFIAYDSRGCGHSHGEYISLGFHEIYDLEAVIKHIHENFVANPQIVLWGRSMGAVTALNYLAKRKKFVECVKVAVLDSPFLNLKEVIYEIVNKKIKAPKVLIDFFLSYLQPSIEEKAGFKVSQFDLRAQIIKIKCPLILMASKSDGLVPFSHLQQIYDSTKGKKSIFYLNESHTDQRAKETLTKIFKTINRYFLAQKKNYQNLQHATINIRKLGGGKDGIQLQSYRSSQFIDEAFKTAKKSVGRTTRKKISLTVGKSENNRDSDLSIEQNKEQIQNTRTQAKKKKLSLNHFDSGSKSVSSYKPLSIRLHQHKEQQSKQNKKLTNLKTTNIYLYKKTEQSSLDNRIQTFSPSNKQNCSARKIANFSGIKRQIKVLNLRPSSEL